MITDEERLAAAIAPIVKGFVERATAAIGADVKALRVALDALPAPEAGERGERGADGKSVTLEDVRPLIESVIETSIARLPKPNDGRDGIDGQDGRDGRDGVDGAKGLDGQDGVGGTSVTLDDCRPMIHELIDQAVANIPAPRDGMNGRDGKDGSDGIGVASAVQDNEGRLRLIMTDSKTIDCGVVQGASGCNGRDGVDGQDGLGFDDLTIDHDGGRNIDIVFSRGHDEKRFALTLPIPIYQGPYTDGQSYEVGDWVTRSGSCWQLVDKEYSAPGNRDSGWRLAVKSGRDGKDGKNGLPGDRGEKGDRGLSALEVMDPPSLVARADDD